MSLFLNKERVYYIRECEFNRVAPVDFELSPEDDDFEKDVLETPKNNEEYVMRMKEYVNEKQYRKDKFTERTLEGFMISRKQYYFAYRQIFFHYHETHESLGPIIVGTYTPAQHALNVRKIIICLRKLAESNFFLNRFSESSELCQKILDIRSKYRKEIPRKAFSLTIALMARIALSQGQFNEAGRLLKEGLFLDPNSGVLNASEIILEKEMRNNVNFRFLPGTSHAFCRSFSNVDNWREEKHHFYDLNTESPLEFKINTDTDDFNNTTPFPFLGSGTYEITKNVFVCYHRMRILRIHIQKEKKFVEVDTYPVYESLLGTIQRDVPNLLSHDVTLFRRNVGYGRSFGILEDFQINNLVCTKIFTRVFKATEFILMILKYPESSLTLLAAFKFGGEQPECVGIGQYENLCHITPSLSSDKIFLFVVPLIHNPNSLPDQPMRNIFKGTLQGTLQSINFAIIAEIEKEEDGNVKYDFVNRGFCCERNVILGLTSYIDEHSGREIVVSSGFRAGRYPEKNEKWANDVVFYLHDFHTYECLRTFKVGNCCTILNQTNFLIRGSVVISPRYDENQSLLEVFDFDRRKKCLMKLGHNESISEILWADKESMEFVTVLGDGNYFFHNPMSVFYQDIDLKERVEYLLGYIGEINDEINDENNDMFPRFVVKGGLCSDDIKIRVTKIWFLYD